MDIYINLISFVILSLFWSTQAIAQTKQDTLQELNRKIEILTEEIEKLKLGKVAEPTYESYYGMGPAASKVYTLQSKGVSIGGYGEVVYENFSTETDDGESSGATNQLDALRLVAYIGYRFNNWLVFNSEIEFEHGKTGKEAPGEVAVELAYIEAQLTAALSLRAGMLLIPVGIINEIHEPPTFQGALRPETERRIIPSTWRANGIGFVGETKSGFGYKLYLTESLYAANFNSNGIRSGRQNGAEALADDLALTGRFDYKGYSGLTVGASFFLGNTGQDLVDASGSSIDSRLSLISAHAQFVKKSLELRALYAHSTIDDVTSLNETLGLTTTNSIGEKQNGYYFNIAYDIFPHFIKNTTHTLVPFVQFEQFNTQSEVPAGFAKNLARERSNLTLGITYKPHPNVAFKADYIDRRNDADTAVDQFNLAVTHLF